MLHSKISNVYNYCAFVAAVFSNWFVVGPNLLVLIFDVETDLMGRRVSHALQRFSHGISGGLQGPDEGDREAIRGEAAGAFGERGGRSQGHEEAEAPPGPRPAEVAELRDRAEAVPAT